MLNQENYDKEVNQSDIPVLMDCWAEWCGPCHMIAPIFEELSKEYEGKVKFAKLNVDENQQVAVEMGIQAIPTLLLLNKGKEVERFVGAMPKDMLKQKLDEALSRI